MEPVNVIRAPSLKRGKNDESLNNRVSIHSLMKHKGSTSLIINSIDSLFHIEMCLRSSHSQTCRST